MLVEVRDLEVHFPIKRGDHLRPDGRDTCAPSTGSTSPSTAARPTAWSGESGCGKSTLGKAILNLEPPTAGSVTFEGVDIASLKGEELRTRRKRFQMVFQDPMSSLDPRQTVEALLLEGMRAHGLDTDKSATRARLRELMSAVGLPPSGLKKYPHEFSGGQRQRIGIARALSVGPDLIVADEPVSALDVSIQAQVINLLQDLQDELGLTYLVVAHDLAVVRHISDRIGVMYLGGLVEESEAGELYDVPLHPYTRALMSAVPVPDPVVEDSARADPAVRRPALTRQPAVGVPLPHPVPVEAGDPLRHRAPPAAGRRGGRGHRAATGWRATSPSRSPRGELQPHEVAPELVAEGFGGRDPRSTRARRPRRTSDVGAQADPLSPRTRRSTRPRPRPGAPGSGGTVPPLVGQNWWNEHQSHSRDGLGCQSPVSWASRIAAHTASTLRSVASRSASSGS